MTKMTDEEMMALYREVAADESMDQAATKYRRKHGMSECEHAESMRINGPWAR